MDYKNFETVDVDREVIYYVEVCDYSELDSKQKRRVRSVKSEDKFVGMVRIGVNPYSSIPLILFSEVFLFWNESISDITFDVVDSDRFFAWTNGIDFYDDLCDFLVAVSGKVRDDVSLANV